MQNCHSASEKHKVSALRLCLKDDGAGEVSVLNVSEYCGLLSRLGQEFADRLSDFEKLEHCVTFMANPFIDVDISEISGRMAELLCVDPVEMEIEVINLQNNAQLKSQQHSQHFLSLVEPDNYENLHQAALKMSALLGSTYLCESTFSDMNVIQNKTDSHLNDSIKVNLSGYTPQYTSLVDSMQCQSSH